MSILRTRENSSVVTAVSAANLSRMQATRLPLQKRSAFTILELLVVITIIIVLAGLILSTVGYVQNKGARSRAEAEIAAMSTALESYKADNGIYPRDFCSTTDLFDARTSTNVADYRATSLYLYKQLSGDSQGNRQPPANAKTYFAFKPNQLSPTDQSQPVQFIRDPFGDSYGYSTEYANYSDEVAGNPPCFSTPNPGATRRGYNPTFDLWSTGGIIGTSSPPDQTKWIKNW